MNIIVIGGGVAGLSFALHLKRRGIACKVYESAPDVKELGVGITLLPHAMREFAALGLEEKLRSTGIENRESVFFNRYGQYIYKEARGKFGGYPYPEVGIHRGKLHRILYDTALAELGADTILTNHQCTGVEQDAEGVSVSFKETSTGRALGVVRGDVAIACDGVNSTVRRQFYPNEKMAFAGINTWRGVTRRKPILTGSSYLRIGSIETGKMVIYPIVNDIDGQGNQLINWMAEIRQPGIAMNDWNRSGRLEDVLPIYKDWRFDWLDVHQLIKDSEVILEYPMVDKDPVAQWSFGRITFTGDAAHPMYPRGSNGAAQSVIDARTLADCLADCMADRMADGIAKTGDPVGALKAYEDLRLAPTSKVVRTNREFPPDYIIIKVDELSGGKPFKHIDDVISQAELVQMSEDYKKIAGYSIDAFASPRPAPG